MKTLEITVELKIVEQCPGAETGDACPGGEHRGYLVQVGGGYQGVPDAELPEAIATAVAETAAKAVVVIAKEDPEFGALLEAKTEAALFVAERDDSAPSVADAYRVLGESFGGSSE